MLDLVVLFEVSRDQVDNMLLVAVLFDALILQVFRHVPGLLVDVVLHEDHYGNRDYLIADYI